MKRRPEAVTRHAERLYVLRADRLRRALTETGISARELLAQLAARELDAFNPINAAVTYREDAYVRPAVLAAIAELLDVPRSFLDPRLPEDAGDVERYVRMRKRRQRQEGR